MEKSEFEPRLKKSKERLAKLQAEFDSVKEEQQKKNEFKLVLTRFESFAAKVKQGIEKTPGLPRSCRTGGFAIGRFGLVRLRRSTELSRRLTNVFFVGGR